MAIISINVSLILKVNLIITKNVSDGHVWKWWTVSVNGEVRRELKSVWQEPKSVGRPQVRRGYLPIRLRLHIEQPLHLFRQALVVGEEAEKIDWMIHFYINSKYDVNSIKNVVRCSFAPACILCDHLWIDGRSIHTQAVIFDVHWTKLTLAAM